MYNERATFNAYIRSLIDSGIPLHLEPQEETKWPSYRVSWLSSDNPTRREGWLSALVQVDIRVPNGDTATAYQRAERLSKAMGLTNPVERPRIHRKDWTNPASPSLLSGSIEYEAQFGKGWQNIPTSNPSQRHLALTLNLYYPASLT